MEKKTIRKIIITILSAIAFIVLAIFVAQTFLQIRLQKELVKNFQSDSSKIKMTVENAKVSLLSGCVLLENILIKSDTSAEANTENRPSYMIEASIPELKISGIPVLKTITKKALIARSIECIGVKLRITLKEKEPADTLKEESISMIFPVPVHADELKFEIASTDISIFQEKNHNELHLNNTVLSLSRWDAAKGDTFSWNHFKGLDLHNEKADWITTDSFYTFSVRNIRIRSSDSTFKTDSMILMPKLSEHQFSTQLNKEVERFEMKSPGMVVSDFSPWKFLIERKIEANQIAIRDLSMKIFTDERKPEEVSPSPMLHDIILNFPFRLAIDTLNINNANVTYRAYGSQSVQPGSLHYSHINVHMNHITNDSASLAVNDTMSVSVSARIMGTAFAKAKMVVPLMSPNKLFYCTGSCTEFDFKKLNEYSEHVEFIYFEEGKVSSLRFAFSADQYKSSGTVDMRYDGLDLHFIDSQKIKTKNEEKLKGLLVKHFLIERENPSDGGEARIGTIDLPRDPDSFIVSYCWKSINSGIKSTVGLKDKSLFIFNLLHKKDKL